jgi:surface antigen
MRRRAFQRAALVAAVGSLMLAAGDGDPATAQAPGMPASRTEPAPPGLDLRATLDENDELAVLYAIHTRLANVADGSTYVWHRHHGRLSGVVQPTASFKGRDGAPCRHLVVMLMAGRHIQRTEGIACRIDGRRWSLQG